MWTIEDRLRLNTVMTPVASALLATYLHMRLQTGERPYREAIEAKLKEIAGRARSIVESRSILSHSRLVFDLYTDAIAFEGDYVGRIVMTPTVMAPGWRVPVEHLLESVLDERVVLHLPAWGTFDARMSCALNLYDSFFDMVEGLENSLGRSVSPELEAHVRKLELMFPWSKVQEAWKARLP